MEFVGIFTQYSVIRLINHKTIGLVALTLGLTVSFIQASPGKSFFLMCDEKITHFLEGKNRQPFWDYSMELLCLGTPVIELGTVASMWTTGSDDSRQLLIAMGATQPAVVTLKYLVDRPRPQRRYQPRLWNTRITPSFPSGHATATAAYVTVLSQQYPGSKPLLISYLFLSGYAQVYIGNHYLSDILAGWVMGYGIGRLVERNSSPSTGIVPQTTSLRVAFAW